MNDDDLLDPRRTRDIREAIRRAREARKRELAVSANREPFDQPILARDERSGEDTVLDVRPAPLERTPPPIVPPVSVDEVQERVNEMRQPRRIHDLPPSVHFDRSDQHFSEIPERAARPSPPELSRLPEPAGFTPFAAPVTEFEPAESDPEPPLVDATLWPATAADDEGGLEAWAQTVHADEETSWPEQAPWADEPPPYEAWEERPKRRSWFGSLLHRQPRQPRVDPDASMRAWEPSPVDDHYPDDEPAPWEAQAGAEYDDRTAYDEPDVSELPPATRTLPPLPYDGDDEFRDDYLLADARYSDIDDEDHAARQIEHICATCRYFRRDGTCGNAFAFTFRRRVSEEYLSCASSIGVWWLPSDHYWESVVDVAHHGQPTPLLDRYAIRADEQESDDELRTP